MKPSDIGVGVRSGDGNAEYFAEGPRHTTSYTNPEQALRLAEKDALEISKALQITERVRFLRSTVDPAAKLRRMLDWLVEPDAKERERLWFEMIKSVSLE